MFNIFISKYSVIDIDAFKRTNEEFLYCLVASQMKQKQGLSSCEHLNIFISLLTSVFGSKLFVLVVCIKHKCILLPY